MLILVDANYIIRLRHDISVDLHGYSLIEMSLLYFVLGVFLVAWRFTHKSLLMRPA